MQRATNRPMWPTHKRKAWQRRVYKSLPRQEIKK